MATETATRNELADLLQDGEVPLADVTALVPEGVLARAWAAGDIEFGRPCHCVTGRPGVPESNPTLIIEDGVDWTGPKTMRHKPYKGVAADLARVPNCREFKKYVREVSRGKDSSGFEHWQQVAEVPEGEEFRWVTTKITREEVVSLLRPLVRFTDKGLAATTAAG